MKNSKLKFSEYMQNISRSKSFGKFVLIVYVWLGILSIYSILHSHFLNAKSVLMKLKSISIRNISSLFQLCQPSYCQWWQSTTYFPRKYVGLDFMIFKREIMNILTLTSGHTHMIHSNEWQSNHTVPVFMSCKDQTFGPMKAKDWKGMISAECFCLSNLHEF